MGVDHRLAEEGLQAARRFHHHVLVQRHHLGRRIIDAAARREIDGRSVLPFAGAVDALQLENAGLGHVLGDRLCGQLVGTRIAREARQPRLLHGDLGAGDHQAAEIDRQLVQHAHRVELHQRHRNHGRRDHQHRDGATQKTHMPAVPDRRPEHACAVAGAGHREGARCRSVRGRHGHLAQPQCVLASPRRQNQAGTLHPGPQTGHFNLLVCGCVAANRGFTYGTMPVRLIHARA